MWTTQKNKEPSTISGTGVAIWSKANFRPTGHQIKGRKNKHAHPDAWNFVHWLPRYATVPLCYNCCKGGNTSPGNYGYPSYKEPERARVRSQFTHCANLKSHNFYHDTTTDMLIAQQLGWIRTAPNNKSEKHTHRTAKKTPKRKDFIINLEFPIQITYFILYLLIIQIFKSYPQDQSTFISTNFVALLKRDFGPGNMLI
jgi:hypothetical protein